MCTIHCPRTHFSVQCDLCRSTFLCSATGTCILFSHWYLYSVLCRNPFLCSATGTCILSSAGTHFSVQPLVPVFCTLPGHFSVSLASAGAHFSFQLLVPVFCHSDLWRSTFLCSVAGTCILSVCPLQECVCEGRTESHNSVPCGSPIYHYSMVLITDTEQPDLQAGHTRGHHQAYIPCPLHVSLLLAKRLFY